MRTSALTFLPLLALVLVLAVDVARSDEETPSQDEIMKLWQQVATPGEHHASMEFFVGSWTTQMKVEAPGDPAQVSKGTSEFSWLLPGRWLQERFSGTMMGMPFEGHGMLGFDNHKKKWVTTWVDSMSTAMLVGEGVVVDPTGKVRVLYASMDEWITGEHDKVAKMVTRITGDDSFTFELWDMGIGEQGKPMIHVAYTRKK